MNSVYIYHERNESSGSLNMRVFTNKMKAIGYFDNCVSNWKEELQEDDIFEVIKDNEFQKIIHTEYWGYGVDFSLTKIINKNKELEISVFD